MRKPDRSTLGASLSTTVDLTVAQSGGAQSGGAQSGGTPSAGVQSAEQPGRPTAHPKRPVAKTPAVPEDAGGPDQAQQGPRLSADLQAVIGQQLRAVYHEILKEPVPDRFVRLLNELATKEASPQ
jgi:hypothetical protein